MKNGSGHNWDHIIEQVSKVIDSVKSYDTAKIIFSLKDFIPEYSPDRNFDSLKIKKSSIIEQ